jgi:hypothetical protein
MMGWHPHYPVYLTTEPRLRMWATAGEWFVDDVSVPLSGPGRRTFKWDVESLSAAVNAAAWFIKGHTHSN